jgi:hypothetical protein
MRSLEFELRDEPLLLPKGEPDDQTLFNEMNGYADGNSELRIGITAEARQNIAGTAFCRELTCKLRQTGGFQ